MIKFLALFLLTSFSIGQYRSEYPKNSPLSILSVIEDDTIESNIPLVDFDPLWVDSLKLLLPCEGIPVPKRTMRLPNAPRSYRNGIHKGIDFFANWGTPIRTVASGVVVRADQNYKEVPADFREDMLKASSKVGNTPSDIFNNILFYVIIVFIILTSGVLLFVTRSSSFYIFEETLNTFSRKKKVLKNTITIPHEFLSYYLSVIWWMIFYLIIVTIFVSVAKIKHDPELIYNMF